MLNTPSLTGVLLVLVDVDLDDLQPGFLLAGDLLEHRPHQPARSAPRRPEVDQHRLVGLQSLRPGTLHQRFRVALPLQILPLLPGEKVTSQSIP